MSPMLRAAPLVTLVVTGCLLAPGASKGGADVKSDSNLDSYVKKCPMACELPRCIFVAGVRGSQALVKTRCHHSCSPIKPNGARLCGVGPAFEGPNSVDCRDCAHAPSVGLWQGMCYTPLPRPGYVRDGIKSGNFQDDWMTEDSIALWGPNGRNDLSTIKQMGANRVRMYGNNPENNHRPFLDYASKVGLDVIAGISDWPYTQMKGNCNDLRGDCFDVIRESYGKNLLRGFLVGNVYHPALDHLIVINEPELKMTGEAPPKAFVAIDPKFWVKSVLSAIDGIVQAEKEHNVTGHLIPLTVTMTFGFCNLCIGQSGDPTDASGAGSVPGLGQMRELARGLLTPAAYGYVPTNDLTDVYLSRILMSLNTKNPFTDISDLFLKKYEQQFPHMPLFFEEYHCWYAGYEENRSVYEAQKEDLTAVLNHARTSSTLLGVNFFEFQASLDKVTKAGEADFEELQFGIFSLGDYTLQDTNIFNFWTPVQCLASNMWNNTLKEYTRTNDVTRAVTEAFGGVGLEEERLCRPDPKKVQLTAAGYHAVKSIGQSGDACLPEMQTFVERLVMALGGHAPSANRGLRQFAIRYCGDGSGFIARRRLETALDDGLKTDTLEFETMVDELIRRPGWAYWSTYPTCVASRDSDNVSVGRMIDQVCFEKLRFFDCVHVPAKCRMSILHQADYVLSTYFDEQVALYGRPNPLKECYFNGSAIYASATYQFEEFMNSDCVVSKDPAVTPLTDEGYAAVRRSEEPGANQIFIMRVMKKMLHNATVCNEEEFRKFFTDPSLSLTELHRDLNLAWWVCDGTTDRRCLRYKCQPDDGSSLLRHPFFVITVGVTICVLMIATMLTCIYARNLPEESEVWAAKHMKRGVYLPHTTVAQQRMQQQLQPPQRPHQQQRQFQPQLAPLTRQTYIEQLVPMR